MKYDFSKIETEDLREACEYFEAHGTMSCMGIDCYVCPLKERACGCVRKPYVAINKEEKYKLFKEELIRREKMENKMPELEAGMIVDIESYCGITRCILLGTDQGLQPIAENWNWQCNMKECEVLRIYKSEATNYELVFNGDAIEPIWSKKSDKDIKIEELEATIKKAQEQIQELKG